MKIYSVKYTLRWFRLAFGPDGVSSFVGWHTYIKITRECKDILCHETVLDENELS
jgi:hypothetical protein